jgi:cytoskeletal protein RodZ
VESLGEKLRSARELKHINYEQVSRDTNIAVRYLEALENEDFSGFPGDAYVIGFLGNYGAYLELDIQELLSLYRAFKKMEQPVPVELLNPPSRLPKIVIAAGVALAVLGIAGGGIALAVNRPPKPLDAGPVKHSPVEHTMDAGTFERRFYRGDSILVPVGTDHYKLELINLGEAVTLRTPGGQVIIDLSQEANVDINNDGMADLRITAADFAKNNPDMGVLLRFDMDAAAPAAASSGDLPPESVNAAGFSGATVIFSSPNPYPFTLQSNFPGYCMFRWEILFERDRPGRNEQYFQRGNELSIQAQNGIRLWASNAQAAKYQVIGGGRTVPLELGGAGEVVVADIRWARDDENRWRLVLVWLETGAP